MEYAKEQIDKMAEEINKMSHYEMCRRWRFCSTEPLLRTDLITSSGESLGEIFKKRLFNHFGGFTPEISKAIGWVI